MEINDGLLLFGKPYHVTRHVIVNNPTIEEIFDFGEQRYFSTISTLLSNAWDLRLFFHEQGRDYVEVSDFEVFFALSQDISIEDTWLILGDDIDLSRLFPVEDPDTGQHVLVNQDGETIFDEQVYLRMADFIRKCHHMKRVFRIPGNETTRIAYMEEAKRKQQLNRRRKKKKETSILAPLVSALCNKEGFKYNYNSVRDLSIYAFMDAVYRLQIIDQYEYLMGGLYSGMISLKEDAKTKQQLDWMRTIE